MWGFSSAGRAPALQAGGQRFDPANLHHILKRLTEVPLKEETRGVSSAGRAPALQAGGHRFDPGTLHQKRLTEASGNRGFIESLEDSKMYLEN